MRCHSWMWAYPHTSWGPSGVVNHDTVLGFAPNLERSTWRAMLLELPQRIPLRRWVYMCNIPIANNIFRRARAWLKLVFISGLVARRSDHRKIMCHSTTWADRNPSENVLGICARRQHGAHLSQRFCISVLFCRPKRVPQSLPGRVREGSVRVPGESWTRL